METSHIVLLTISASISFAVGRTVMHFRKKRKYAEKLQSDQQAAQALRNMPPGPESKNKAKRKRQQREAQR